MMLSWPGRLQDGQMTAVAQLADDDAITTQGLAGDIAKMVETVLIE